MNDYMRALHQRFFQEPDCTEIRRELEALRLTLRDKLDRQDRETLLKLTDLAIELRETIRGRHGPQTGGRTLGGPHRGRP